MTLFVEKLVVFNVNFMLFSQGLKAPLFLMKLYSEKPCRHIHGAHQPVYFIDYKLCIKLLPPCVSSACPVGHFKSVSGSAPCSVCPSNSRTSQKGSSMCECRSGFYRGANDANSSACTSELCVFVCLCPVLSSVFEGPPLPFTPTVRTRMNTLFFYYYNIIDIYFHQPRKLSGILVSQL